MGTTYAFKHFTRYVTLATNLVFLIHSHLIFKMKFYALFVLAVALVPFAKARGLLKGYVEKTPIKKNGVGKVQTRWMYLSQNNDPNPDLRWYTKKSRWEAE